MVLYIVLFTTTVRRVHQNNIKLIRFGIVQNVLGKRIVMIYAGHINIVKQHVRNTQHVRELLLFNSIYGRIVFVTIISVRDFPIEFIQPAGEEAASTAGKICHLFTNLRLDHFRHEVSYSTRRVEFTRRTCALQFTENRLIYLTEGMAFFVVAKVEVINYIENLT